MAYLENRIAQMAMSRDILNVDEFLARTNIPRSTGYKLWNNHLQYPSKENTLIICESFLIQPGAFLGCVFPPKDGDI